MTTDTTTGKRRLWWRHAISVAVFPATMAIVVPALIGVVAGVRLAGPGSGPAIASVIAGVLLSAGGVALMIWTVVLFDRFGAGTLGIGSVMGEPVHLVVRGPYRHVRNPMITGVLSILLGEAALTLSGWLLGWFAVFAVVQVLAIRCWEEPHLLDRYGSAYREYRRHVPGWIPRVTPWTPQAT